MKYNSITGINKRVSALIFGCAGEVMQAGADNSVLLDAAFENGINTFDTARGYGQSEVSLGNWVKSRGNREDVVIITKGCHPLPDTLSVNRVTKNTIDEDLEASLQKLQTDYVDLYLLHRDDISIPVAELIDALEEKKKQGKIVQYGVSNWTLDRFIEANEYAKSKGYDGFVVNSPNFSLAEQVLDPWQSGSEAISIGGKAGKASREYFMKNNIPVISYSPLARGLFSGKVKSDEIKSEADASKAMDRFALRGYYSKENIEKLRRVEELAKSKAASVSQIALAYLLCQELTVYPIIGFSKESHLKDNLGALELELTMDEITYLES